MTTREKLAAVLRNEGWSTALDALEAIVAEERDAAIEEAAKICSMASVKHPSCIDGIGGLKWKQYNEAAQMMAHATCQVLSVEIRALKKAKP